MIRHTQAQMHARTNGSSPLQKNASMPQAKTADSYNRTSQVAVGNVADSQSPSLLEQHANSSAGNHKQAQLLDSTMEETHAKQMIQHTMRSQTSGTPPHADGKGSPEFHSTKAGASSVTNTQKSATEKNLPMVESASKSHTPWAPLGSGRPSVLEQKAPSMKGDHADYHGRSQSFHSIMDVYGQLFDSIMQESEAKHMIQHKAVSAARKGADAHLHAEA